eukprot:1159327-Pelagomonas_calceolata.AAC.5
MVATMHTGRQSENLPLCSDHDGINACRLPMHAGRQSEDLLLCSDHDGVNACRLHALQQHRDLDIKLADRKKDCGGLKGRGLGKGRPAAEVDKGQGYPWEHLQLNGVT